MTSDNFSSGGSTEEEQYENLVSFSAKYQFKKLHHTILFLQSTQQYSRARRLFYENLGWFAPMFDTTFPTRCIAIEKRYSQEKYLVERTYEQVEELKYLHTVIEFVRMLWDATTRRRSKMRTDIFEKTEAVPIGFGGIIDTEAMSAEFFNRLVQVQGQQQEKDIQRFFYHGLPWFSGIFDLKFIKEGYVINNLDASDATKYKKSVTSFSRLLTRRSVLPTPFASMIYPADVEDDIPHSVSDIVKRKAKPIEREALRSLIKQQKEADLDE